MLPTTDAEAARVAERYRRFATEEAPGRSELYAQWADGVANDPVAQRLLARLPAARRQPPLVFAVTRMLGAAEGDYPAWSRWLAEHVEAVAAECVARGLQTNEPLRCAALLPALALVDGPLALLEVGASAGLCLYPDRYSYRYEDGPDLDPVSGPSPVVLRSRAQGLPELRPPEVVWRAGIDLAPLDAASVADRRFLTSLVWPGEEGRTERITAALDLVREDPPLLVAGDATADGLLAGVAEAAPAGATLIVTTPGVLPHIPRAGRERLFAQIDALRATRPGTRWVSIDPPALHHRWGRDAASWPGFVLGMDERALAVVDPLGAWVEWRAADVAARG